MIGCLMVYLRRLLMPLHDEEGQDLVEYALIIASVSILLVVALTTLKNQIVDVFEYLC